MNNTSPGALAGSAPSPAPSSPASAAPHPLYWGAWIGNQFTGSEAPWDWNAVTHFEQQDSNGKPPSVVQWSSPFISGAWCGGNCDFDASTFERVREHGMIPFFSWANSGIADRDIARGGYDAYIAAWARAASSWGHPFFLRFDWEMNGSWFDWGVGNGTTDNTAADYVAAWQHVHDIFVANGASNATWVWCPNIAVPGRAAFANIAAAYPGDEYVDWTCLDGYNDSAPWTSFSDLFSPSYDLITQTVAPSKPMIIGEVGSSESGGSKARWIGDMFSALPTRFPAIRGVLWFDKYESGPGGYSDWPLESSSSSAFAFAEAVQPRGFTSNTFASLDSSPIPSPGS